jgi:hypothetical protein
VAKVKTTMVGEIKIPTDEPLTGMVTFKKNLLVFTPNYTYIVRRLKWWERLLKWTQDKFGVEETQNAGRPD